MPGVDLVAEDLQLTLRKEIQDIFCEDLARCEGVAPFPAVAAGDGACEEEKTGKKPDFGENRRRSGEEWISEPEPGFVHLARVI